MSLQDVLRQMNRARTADDIAAAKRAAREHLKDHPADELAINEAMESLSMLEDALPSPR